MSSNLPTDIFSCSACLTQGTTWTVAHQAPLSVEFSRLEYWSGLTFTSPGDLPDPGIEPRPPSLWADSLLSEPPGKPSNEKLAIITSTLQV